MTIKVGQSGTEISEIYYGNTPIKEIYNGSTLVYSSGLPVWKFVRSDAYLYLIGNYNTSSIPCYAVTTAGYSASRPIQRINGVLGTSGSTVYCTIDGVDYDFSYTTQKVVNGKTVYEYTDTGWGYYLSYLYVLEGSVAGSVCFISFAVNMSNTFTLTDTTLVLNNYTYTRDNTYKGRWTTAGVTPSV